MVVIDTLPGAMVAPLAGAIVDGLNKRTVMVLADVARMFFMLVILLRPTLTTIYLMTALHSIATIFFQPAKSAAMPLVVKQDELPQANAIEQSAINVILIAGPIIGAVLLNHFGLTTTLLVDVLSFLVSALLVARATVRHIERKPLELSVSGAMNEIREGCRYLAQHRLALHLNLLLFVALVCTSLWIPLAPFFIRDHLGAPEELLGWQLGLFGFGAVIGGFLAPRVIDRLGIGVTLFAAFVGEALSLMCYGIVANVRGSMLIVFFWGVVLSIIVVPFYSILQRIVDEQFLGRVFSLVKQSENVAIALAMLGAVLLQGFATVSSTFLVAGLVYLSFTVVSSLTEGGRVLLATR